ncbi:MAG: ACT domain-containing protein [Acidilobaceae archaeon]
MARVSIASVVRGLILSKPFLRGCLAEGIVNYSSLARLLSEELKVRGITASHGAIKMSLIRVRNEILESEKELKVKLKLVLGSTVLQIQSDLIVVTVRKHRVILKLVELVKLMESSRFFQILQGVNTFTFIVSKEDSVKLLEIVGREDIIEVLNDQTAVILVSPKEIVETPGVVALIASTLYENDINITQIVSCYNDTIILVESAKAWEAYRVLETLIKSMRSQLQI